MCPSPSALCELWLAAERDAAHNLVRAGIDGCGVLGAATVKGEDSFGGGIVEDGVRILAGQVDPANDLHLFRVEDVDRTLCAEESAFEFGSENDGVRAMRFADVGKLLSAGVYYEYMFSARDEDVAGGWIDIKIIPAALSTESNLLHQRIVGGVGRGVRQENECHERNRNQEHRKQGRWFAAHFPSRSLES